MESGADRRATPFRVIFGQQTSGSRQLSLDSASPREWADSGYESTTFSLPMRYSTLELYRQNGGHGQIRTAIYTMLRYPSNR